MQVFSSPANGSYATKRHFRGFLFRSDGVFRTWLTRACDLQSPITNLEPTMFFSLVLPTLNEAPNLARMVGAIQRVLSGLAYEVIVADDKSPDGTGRIADELAAADAHIR